MKNQISLIGRAGRDAEKVENNGRYFISFSFAVAETWMDKQGERQEKTTWFTIQKGVKDDSKLADYIKKGDILAIDGTPKARAYKKKNGDLAAEIVVNATTIDISINQRKAEAAELPISQEDDDNTPF